MAEAKFVDANSAKGCGRLLPENGGLLALRLGDARGQHKRRPGQIGRRGRHGIVLARDAADPDKGGKQA